MMVMRRPVLMGASAEPRDMLREMHLPVFGSCLSLLAVITFWRAGDVLHDGFKREDLLFTLSAPSQQRLAGTIDSSHSSSSPRR